MKYVIVLLCCFSLFSCMNIAKDVSPNTTLSDDMVFVVGKVSFEPEIKQELNILAPNAEKTFNASFCANEKVSPDEFVNVIFTVFKNWNEYFLLSFPKQDMYLRRVQVMVKKGMNSATWLNIHLNQPVHFDNKDDFVYIGDLVFRFGVKNELGGDDNMLEVRDNIDKAKKKFAGYIKDRNGKNSTLKSMLWKSGKVNVKIVKESVGYSGGY